MKPAAWMKKRVNLFGVCAMGEDSYDDSRLVSPRRRVPPVATALPNRRSRTDTASPAGHLSLSL